MDSLMVTISHIQRTQGKGGRATLLGKDVVSAFNNLHTEGTMQSLRVAGADPQSLLYVSRFLAARRFSIKSDGKHRGTGRMNQGTQQGSPLSPILWLAYIDRTLEASDWRIQELPTNTPLPPERVRRSLAPRNQPMRRTLLFSFVDDVNPLVITQGLKDYQHNVYASSVDRILEE